MVRSNRQRNGTDGWRISPRPIAGLATAGIVLGYIGLGLFLVPFTLGVLGLALGVLFAVLVSRPLADEGFTPAIPPKPSRAMTTSTIPMISSGDIAPSSVQWTNPSDNRPESARTVPERPEMQQRRALSLIARPSAQMSTLVAEKAGVQRC